MKGSLVFFLSFILLSAGKKDGIPGVYIEVMGMESRCISEPNGKVTRIEETTKIHGGSRAEILWIDRNHQYAIARHVALSGNGMWIQAGWALNNKRTSLYRTLGSELPVWSYPMPYTENHIPVAVSINGSDIAIGGTDEPFYSFGAASSVPKWIYSLPGGFEIATSTHGPTVYVSDDGSRYAVLAISSSEGRLFIFNAFGDTIRTMSFDRNLGIYGLDANIDGSVYCVSTYRAIYIFNLDGSRRDSIGNYGQTVAKISGDGTYLVKGDFYSKTYLYRWNGIAYNLVWQHNTGHPWVTAVAISDDGSTIMAGTYQYSPSKTGKVLMYDSSSSSPLWQYTQYGDMVASCALSEDGSKGVAGSWGQYLGTYGDVITVFEKASSTPILQILDDIDEPGSIFAVDISKDGSFVTAGGKAVHARQFGNGGQVYAIRILASLNSDVGVEAINAPGIFLQTGQTVTPQAVVKNYGTEAASFNTICSIYDSLAQLLYTDTVFSSNLNPAVSQTINFSPGWNVPTYGRYQTMVFTTLAGDQFPLNDTLINESICYHDGAVSMIHYPFPELTRNYTGSPRVSISNFGSYAENILVGCAIYNQLGSIVYEGNGGAYLSPLQALTTTLSPTWTPTDAGLYTAHFFTQVPEDYVPSNDTMIRPVSITTEIMYDDGLLDSYGFVSANFYDNKYAEKMMPCLEQPYYITGARCYVSSADPIMMSLNSDSTGLPGLGATYYIAPAETIYPIGAGWVSREYQPPIQINDTNPFWMVLHWLSNSPTAPRIGRDDTPPLDSLSYWYHTNPSSPGWHLQASYDFMMRVNTAQEVGIYSGDNEIFPEFIMHTPMPNPFVTDIAIQFSVPRSGKLALNVYDITGRHVTKILDEIMEPGNYSINWRSRDNNGKMLSSGVYFLRVNYEKESITRKLVLVYD
ncbi:T9SS type A sorting domain-containing protein [candidate division WOR-3 bacterium]|nr:T9SS type A sorting domain-containing protein [candidate division WOR-3 bacterium]